MPSSAKVQPRFRRDAHGEVTDQWERHPAQKTRRGKRGGRQKRIGSAIATIRNAVSMYDSHIYKQQHGSMPTYIILSIVLAILGLAVTLACLPTWQL